MLKRYTPHHIRAEPSAHLRFQVGTPRPEHPHSATEPGGIGAGNLLSLKVSQSVKRDGRVHLRARLSEGGLGCSSLSLPGEKAARNADSQALHQPR